MRRNDRRGGRSLTFFAAALTYVLLALIMLPSYRYQINPDGISYLSIAQKYISGDFSHAINGYWGPLYSWLLGPFLLAGIEPLLAVRLLGLVVGLCTLGVLVVLTRDFALSRAATIAVCFAAVPTLVVFSFSFTTPDLLLTSLVLLYSHIVSRAGRAYGPWAGLVGGLAYLAKSYALPFFLLHYVVTNGLHFLAAQSGAAKTKVLRNFCGGLLTFALISGVWITLLSAKYSRPTFSTSGSFNLSKMDPVPRDNPPILVPPPNASAISAWEDPLSLNPPTWSPLRSARDFAHYGKCVVRNLQAIHRILREASPLLCDAILISCLLLVCVRNPWCSDSGRIFLPLLTLTLFCGGYALVLVEPRYLWVCNLLLLLLGGYCYDRLTHHEFFTRGRCYVLLGLLVYSFTTTPRFELAQARASNYGRREFTLAQVLKDHIHPGETLASQSNFYTSLYLAYHLHAPYYGYYGYYGPPTSAGDAERVKTNLRQYNIQHFLVWTKTHAEAFTLPGYQRVSIDGTNDFVLYSRVRTDQDGEQITAVSHAAPGN